MLTFLRTTLPKRLFDLSIISAEAITDLFIGNTLINFILARDDEELNRYFTVELAAAFLIAITALPLALTMRYYWAKNRRDHHEDSHHHSALEEIGEFLLIGAPFGILTYGSAKDNLGILFPKHPYPSLALSIYLGVMSSLGNYQLHSAHAHAENGYFQLIKALSPRQRPLAILLSLSVLFGHAFEGFLDGDIFFGSFTRLKPVIKYIGIAVLSLLVTIFEGQTEMRSTLLNQQHQEDFREIRALTKALTFPAAILHALQPVLGCILLLEIFFNKTAGFSLRTDLAGIYRIAILGLTSFLIGYPNGKGFYSAVLPGVQNTLNQYGLFKPSAPTQATPLLTEREPIPRTEPNA